MSVSLLHMNLCQYSCGRISFKDRVILNNSKKRRKLRHQKEEDFLNFVKTKEIILKNGLYKEVASRMSSQIYCIHIMI